MLSHFPSKFLLKPHVLFIYYHIYHISIFIQITWYLCIITCHCHQKKRMMSMKNKVNLTKHIWTLSHDLYFNDDSNVSNNPIFYTHLSIYIRHAVRPCVTLNFFSILKLINVKSIVNVEYYC